MTITGTTRLLPIIGHPASGVFSPPAFNKAFADKGLDVVMVAMDVPPEALDAFWALLRASSGILGCSVTYPHKQRAFQDVDDLTPQARRLGAINTIRAEKGRLFGDATDGHAMCHAIDQTGTVIMGASSHVLGAGGGAGIAIVDALCERGIAHLHLQDTDPARLETAKQLVAQHWPEVEIMRYDEPADILINATTLGKEATDACPFDPARIDAAKLVCDVVTSPAPTRLIQTARGLGIACVTGEDMGRGQLDRQLAFLKL